MSEGVALILAPVLLLIFIIPLWRITSRTGYPGPLSLLFLVPLANLVLLYVLAFGEWPRDRAR